MENGGEYFFNMMSEDNIVEDFSLPMPVENRSIPTTAAKGGLGRKNHIPTKRTFNFVCHGTTLALIRLLAMSSQEMPIGKELLSTIMPTATLSPIIVQTLLNTGGVQFKRRRLYSKPAMNILNVYTQVVFHIKSM